LPPPSVITPKKCVPPPPDRPIVCRLGEQRVDELSTRHFNTVLDRGCGTFYIHEVGGNARVVTQESGFSAHDPFAEAHRRQVPVRPEIPSGDSPRDTSGGRDRLVDLGPPSGPAWILALRGCGLDQIASVTVSGGDVGTTKVAAEDISSWLVPLSPAPAEQSSRIPTLFGGKDSGASTAFIRFVASSNAAPAVSRTIKVTFADGASQTLQQIANVVARNGQARLSSSPSVRWEEQTTLRYTGSRIGNAALDGPACAARSQVAANSETSLEIGATLFCPREVTDPETGEVAVVHRPSCICRPIAYDRLLSIYFELPKDQFSYIRTVGLDVGPNLDYLGSNPGLIGDSLAHGFYGGALKPETQLWAYPHQVVAQMGGRTMSQNLVRFGPGAEDAIKSFLFLEYGEAPDSILFTDDAILDDEQRDFVSLADGEDILDGETTFTPMHAGVAGMDYTNVLRTSGRCLDVDANDDFPVRVREPVSGSEEEREKARYNPKPICEERGFGCDGPAAFDEAQLGLACSDRTPIEIMEETSPTFVFASAAGNHFLSCAVHTRARNCIEMDRFFRDSSEVFRRLRRISSIRGGVVFGVPPLAQIAYLEEQTSAPAGLKPFWKRPGEADTAGEVLDADEVEFLRARIEEANLHLRDLAELNGYAYVDATETFNRIDDEGVPIVDPSDGSTICRVHPEFPTKSLDLVDALVGPDAGNDTGCGMFSLDGIHPTEVGHAIMTNEIIDGINAFYGLEVPKLSSDELFEIWQHDSLNRDPIDMGAFLRKDGIADCIAPAALEAQGLAITVPVCATTGAFCVESVGLLAAALATGGECVESILNEFGVRPGYMTVDRQAAPLFCWGGDQDRSECRFLNPDGQVEVED
jgi:hypothetical protein